MTVYQRIAVIEQNKEIELWEAGEYLNGDMGDYYIMWENPSTYYLVKEQEEGDVYVGGDFAEVGGDFLASTDEVAEYLEGENYSIVEFPNGNRKLAWIDE